MAAAAAVACNSGGLGTQEHICKCIEREVKSSICHNIWRAFPWMDENVGGGRMVLAEADNRTSECSSFGGTCLHNQQTR